MCENNDSPSVFLPVLILALTFVIFLGAQTWMLSTDRGSLTETYNKQSEALEQVEKARTQVGSLIKGLLELEKQDNRNAAAIIDNLKRSGVNFQDAPEGQGQAVVAPAAAMPSEKPVTAPEAPAKKK